jgi:hypothetical protein
MLHTLKVSKEDTLQAKCFDAIDVRPSKKASTAEVAMYICGIVTACSVAYVQKALASLEEKGLIKAEGVPIVWSVRE